MTAVNHFVDAACQMSDYLIPLSKDKIVTTFRFSITMSLTGCKEELHVSFISRRGLWVKYPISFYNIRLDIKRIEIIWRSFSI